MKKLISLVLSLALAVCLSLTATVSFAASEKAVAADTGKKDGNYTVNLSLNGGEVEASVVTPVILKVVDGKGYATIEWENVKYDALVVDGVKLLPTIVEETNGEETRTFEIPVTQYDSVMKVQALNDSGKFEYGLTFKSSGIHKVRTIKDYLLVVAVAFLIFLAAVIFSVRKLTSSSAEDPFAGKDIPGVREEAEPAEEPENTPEDE